MLLSAPLSAACAQSNQDGQLWTGVAVVGPVRGNLGLFLFAESRFGEDMSRLVQTVYAAGLGWDPGKGRSLYSGYLLVNTYPRRGPTAREHRLWQQAAYPIHAFGPVRITGRTLLEQRHFEGFGDIGFRLQQNFRATVPVDRNGRFKLVAYGDLMLNFNNTKWGARAGVDQFRYFGGVNLGLAKLTSIEGGYFHQHIVRPEVDDRTNHIALVTIIQRFNR